MKEMKTNEVARTSELEIADAIATGTRLGYSVKEVAAVVGCSPRHIRNLIDRKELPSIRFGERVMIPSWALREKLSGEPEDRAA